MNDFITDQLDYQKFLASKMAIPKPVGIDVSIDKINKLLYHFQTSVVQVETSK